MAAAEVLRQAAQRAARHGEAHLPAGRGGRAAGRGGRRAPHDQGRRIGQSRSRRQSSACTSAAPGPRGHDRLPRRARRWRARTPFRITVKGRQTHGARPWDGVDPIVIASQIVLGLQTIQSRQVDVTTEPSVLTVGIFNAGNRSNIIPDKAELEGTLRTFRPGDARLHHAAREGDRGSDRQERRRRGHGRMDRRRATSRSSTMSPLTHRMVPTLRRVVGDDKVIELAARHRLRGLLLLRREMPGCSISRRHHAARRRRHGSRSTTRRAFRSMRPACCRPAGDPARRLRLYGQR